MAHMYIYNESDECVESKLRRRWKNLNFNEKIIKKL